jgi:uncharacterized protein (DUF1697 family)
MTTYIALLRGINVSGKNIIKMVELKQLFKNEGFNNVTTYIQSGNILFDSNETSITKLEQTITDLIKKQFGHSIKILVLTKDYLNKVFISNPFLKIETINPKALYVILLKNNYFAEGIKDLEPYLTNNEEFKIIDNCAYIHYPNSAGNSKLTINIFEKKLKTIGTSRNWRTITKLVELSNQ